MLTLANVINRSGNLLLGIGPDINGKILPVMQECLLQIGRWLQINGETIYEARARNCSCQWTKGNREWESKEKHCVSGDAILKQTVDPESGYIVKKVFSTQRGENVYAILPRYPKNKTMLKNVQTRNKTKIALLGSDERVLWERRGNDPEITMSPLYAGELPYDYAWVLELNNLENKGDR